MAAPQFPNEEEQSVRISSGHARSRRRQTPQLIAKRRQMTDAISLAHGQAAQVAWSVWAVAARRSARPADPSAGALPSVCLKTCDVAFAYLVGIKGPARQTFCDIRSLDGTPAAGTAADLARQQTLDALRTAVGAWPRLHIPCA